MYDDRYHGNTALLYNIWYFDGQVFISAIPQMSIYVSMNTDRVCLTRAVMKRICWILSIVSFLGGIGKREYQLRTFRVSNHFEIMTSHSAIRYNPISTNQITPHFWHPLTTKRPRTQLWISHDSHENGKQAGSGHCNVIMPVVSAHNSSLALPACTEYDGRSAIATSWETHLGPSPTSALLQIALISSLVIKNGYISPCWNNCN